jgi:hypothetical protein
MGKVDTVGFVVHCVHKESNLSYEMGMGIGNYRGHQWEYASDVLGGHVHSSQREHPQISRGIFLAA